MASKSDSEPLPPVVHSRAKKQFSLKLPQGTATLPYDILESGELEYSHTEVPESCRGKGLGAVLAKAAFDYAVESGKKVHVTCTYLHHYLDKHPNPQYLAASRITRPS
eukprot:scpid66312/ scgid16272/ Protein GTLF3B